MDGTSSGDSDASETETLPSQLPCRSEGYPCTFNEVPDEVGEKTLQYGSLALRKVSSNDPSGAIQWLECQPEVVEAEGSSNAIRFRLEDGRPMWVLLQSSRAPSPTQTRSSSLSPSSGRTDQSTKTRRSELVVHKNRPRDQKYARIVAPFADELSLNADNPSAGNTAHKVENILKQTRGYQDGKIKATYDDDVGLQDFKDWRNYDTIFLETHGGCLEDECNELILLTGIPLTPYETYIDFKKGTDQCKDAEPPASEIQAYEQNKQKWDQLKEQAQAKLSSQIRSYGLVPTLMDQRCEIEDVPGSSVKKRKCQLRYEIAVTDEFFSQYYPTDVFRNSLIVVNGCKSATKQTDDIRNSLISQTASYVGWSETVRVSSAQDALVPLFEKMSNRRLAASEALETLPDSVRSIPDHPVACSNKEEGPTLRQIPASKRMRIREIATLQTPSGTEVSDGMSVNSILDGAPGDGQPDELKLSVKVEGI